MGNGVKISFYVFISSPIPCELSKALMVVVQTGDVA